MADKDAIEDIEPGGDVVLVCGTGATQKKIRVASDALMRGSKVFKAMLSPRFQEGARLATANGSVEISLPEDDGYDMLVICQLLHCQSDKVPSELTADRVVGLARLADKYDLGAAMATTVRGWIVPLRTAWMKDEEHLEQTCRNRSTVLEARQTRAKLLIASYHLRCGELFEKLSQDILLYSNTDDWVFNYVKWEVPDALKHVLYELDGQRKKLRRKIFAAVDRIIQQAALVRAQYGQNCGSDCHYAERRLQYVIDCFMKKQIWPGQWNKTTGCLLRLLEHELDLDSKKWLKLEGSGSCTASKKPSDQCSRFRAPSLDTYRKQMLEEVKGAREEAVRLCYQCLRTKKSLHRPNCPHVAA